MVRGLLSLNEWCASKIANSMAGRLRFESCSISGLAFDLATYPLPSSFRGSTDYRGPLFVPHPALSAGVPKLALLHVPYYEVPCAARTTPASTKATG
jgi:hypothetical protein